MNNNIERFFTDIESFEDNSVEITDFVSKKLKKYISIGTIVKLKNTNDFVLITKICTVHEGKLYDYQGLIENNDRIHFNNEDIVDYEKYFGTHEVLKK